ncbi:MAG: Holliday junction branch migration protein RuvA [Chloroflexota bacterium]
MIASLTGKVQNKDNDSLIVEVGGVGLRVYVPAPTRDHLQVGESVFLHTHLVVREDALTLFGFETKEGCDYFNLLIAVDSVGPRTALSILSALNPDVIRRAIFSEQAEIFTRAPGVGKKTAQKILFSLQDKIKDVDGLGTLTAVSDVDTEVLAALTALGYSVVEAQAALQSIPRDAPHDVETRLTLALQYFSS